MQIGFVQKTEEDRPFKKFVETFTFGDGSEIFEVYTDSGWVDIKSVGKTVEYEIWEIRTKNYTLKCADTHIVYKCLLGVNQYVEIFTNELEEGDFILTESGLEEVICITQTGNFDNMYDLQLSDENRRFYTNGILSHNSIWLANVATNSVRLGYNTAVISLEMRDRKVVKRLGANMLGVSMREYGDFARDKLALKKKLSGIGYSNLQTPGRLYIKEFPTSSAGVPDIEMWLRKMEEMKGMKFKVVVLDYINILKNWRNPNSENMYMKIKQIAEDLRAMAMRNEWAIITATQVNRQGFGSTDLNITNISESSGLGHTVDAMFGIIQDEIMHANREYMLKLLANRDDGYKNSRKKFLIDYDYMTISEDPDSQIINE
jgi:hypothetical protein